MRRRWRYHHSGMIPTKTSVQPSAQPSRFFTEYYGSAFLFLIALFVVAALFVLRPLIDQIKQTNAATQAEIIMTKSEQGYLDSLENSIAAAQTISPDVLARVSQALPDRANVPALLVQFGSAAYANSISIDNLAFNESKAPAKSASGTGAAASVLPVDVSLSIRARSYFDVKRFLADVETSLRIMDVTGMSSGGGEGEVSYNLQLRTYVFGAPTKPVLTR